MYDGIMQLSLPIDEERLKSANDSLRILPFPKAKSQVSSKNDFLQERINVYIKVTTGSRINFALVLTHGL